MSGGPQGQPGLQGMFQGMNQPQPLGMLRQPGQALGGGGGGASGRSPQVGMGGLPTGTVGSMVSALPAGAQTALQQQPPRQMQQLQQGANQGMAGQGLPNTGMGGGIMNLQRQSLAGTPMSALQNALGLKPY